MRFATSTLFFVLKVYCFCTDFCTGAEVKSVLKTAFVKECKRIFQVFLANLRRFFSPSVPIFTVLCHSFPLTLQTLTTELMKLSVVKALLFFFVLGPFFLRSRSVVSPFLLLCCSYAALMLLLCCSY